MEYYTVVKMAEAELQVSTRLNPISHVEKNPRTRLIPDLKPKQRGPHFTKLSKSCDKAQCWRELRGEQDGGGAVKLCSEEHWGFHNRVASGPGL